LRRPASPFDDSGKMALNPKPPAEVTLDPSRVRALLKRQHPDLAGLSLMEVASGWDIVMFRLGDDLAVRLPRRAVAVPLIEREARWLPELAPRLPLAVPCRCASGIPATPSPGRGASSAGSRARRQ
jgi:aminoglycoside phosphotransferase (APT) family kinase protein